MPGQQFDLTTEVTTSYKLFAVGADGVEREFGMATSIDPSERREVTPNFVIGNNPPDEPQELVPQVVRSKTLRIERIALYDLGSLQALINPTKQQISGTAGFTKAEAVIATLSDQRTPLKIVERVTNPAGQVKTRTYVGCIISEFSSTRNIGRGDIRVVDTMTVEYRKVTETAFA